MKFFLSLLSVLAINTSLFFSQCGNYSPSVADSLSTETGRAVHPISFNKQQHPIKVTSQLSDIPHTGSNRQNNQPDTTDQVNQSSPQNNESSSPAQAAPPNNAPAPQSFSSMDTSNAIGFENTLFPIGTFHGNGSVPGDGHIYRWADAPVDNWFLLERSTPQANKVWKLQIGSTIYAQNKAYHVYAIYNGVSHSDPKPLESLKANGGLLIQTCEQACYNSPLTFVLAK
ncbi:hypothetical protein MOO45_07545 [Bombilactobacillus folatiphilus]|uniref:Uncharacterized protein n=1 Tax=Bombilactobacillus folatiphilus TaxID=2923362 RepID=A0ABY4P8V4_9LACO|nr:hypothetical protein [Bombilactobacillus folatiphilus]UQS82031.1 hypothetical protein MOO45_07535 [Bombilactobacillus folatiphilus]UQS82033.1 hypothetical protein MOO45_07545 [Bombilactobacillus folatiphilus]